MSSGTIFFTLVEELQGDADSIPRAVSRAVSKQQGGTLNFYHYVEILYHIVRRHRKPLSTVYLTIVIQQVRGCPLSIKPFKQVAVPFQLDSKCMISIASISRPSRGSQCTSQNEAYANRSLEMTLSCYLKRSGLFMRLHWDNAYDWKQNHFRASGHTIGTSR